MTARAMLALAVLALAGAARADDPVVLDAAAAAAQAAPPGMTTYRLKGAPQLRPIRIGDDGTHTYIEWSSDQPIPAVFALDPRGTEQIVDGYMRGDLFTIDRVYSRLVFRIDKDKAEAWRNSGGGA